MLEPKAGGELGSRNPARIRHGQRACISETTHGLPVLCASRNAEITAIVGFVTRDLVIAEVDTDPGRMSVYADGWQSWSPSLIFRHSQASLRSASARLRDHFYRPGGAEPSDGCRWPVGRTMAKPIWPTATH